MRHDRNPVLNKAIDGTSRLVSVSDCATGTAVGPYWCPDCGAPLVFVSGHARESKTPPIHKRPYFRTKPGAGHKPECEFSVGHALERLVSYSHGTLTESGSRRLLLHIPRIEAARPLHPIRDDRASRVSKAMLKGRDGTGSSVAEIDNEIAATTRLLALSANSITGEGVRAKIDLRWGSRSVLWPEFHVRSDDLPAAYRRVRDNIAGHPFAIQGTVRRVKDVVLSKGRSYVLELGSNHKRPIPSDGPAVNVDIWTTDRAWLEQYKPGCEVMAFGHWVARHSQYLAPRLSMWLSCPGQLFAVEKPGPEALESAGLSPYAVSTSDLAANQLRFLEPRHKLQFSRFVERLAREGPFGDTEGIASSSRDVLVVSAAPDLRVALSVVGDLILVLQVAVKSEAGHG